MLKYYVALLLTKSKIQFGRFDQADLFVLYENLRLLVNLISIKCYGEFSFSVEKYLKNVLTIQYLFLLFQHFLFFHVFF